MKKIIILISLLIFIYSCNHNDYKIENKIHKCIIDNFSSKNIDIIKLVREYEEYLVNNNVLKSKKGEAYVEFYKLIIEKNVIPKIQMNDKFIELYSINPNDLYSIDCLKNIKNENIEEFNSSKYSKLIDEMNILKELSTSNVAKIILNNLNLQDFENEYYKTITLISIVKMSEVSSTIENKNTNFISENEIKENKYENIINIHLTKNNSIEFNKVTISKIQLQNKLETNLSKRSTQINFTNSNETKYDFYLEIQSLIFDTNKKIKEKKSIDLYKKNYNDLNNSEKYNIDSLYNVYIQ